MHDLLLRAALINNAVQSNPRPCRPIFLNARMQLMEPELGNFGNELIQPGVVVGDSGVAQYDFRWLPISLIQYSLRLLKLIVVGEALSRTEPK